MRLVMRSLPVYYRHVMVYAHGDDVYIALKDVIPHLSRSSLHRGLQRHVILPKPAPALAGMTVRGGRNGNNPSQATTKAL